MASVQLDKVHKSFGTHVVLHEVSLSIASGEFMVLVGPSGCGKSTLLRLISGLDEPTGGSVSIDGKRVDRLSPKNRGIAMVFQNYALYPHMTVRENLAFSLKLAGLPRSEIENRVAEAASILSLETQLQKRPGQLSGGQKQRVAMGRAMVRKPSVFLFDEPLSNLDAQLRVRMRSEIALLHRRLKATMIYVTHDQTEAMTLADRIAVLHEGRLQQVGPPLDVYQHPQTEFVASFIGTPSMNLLAFSSLEGIAAPSGTARVGFRPESTRFDGQGVLMGKGKVRLVERLGLSAHVHVRLGEDTVVIDLRPPLEAPPIDRTAEIWVQPQDLFFFDGQGKWLS